MEILLLVNINNTYFTMLWRMSTTHTCRSALHQIQTDTELQIISWS